MTIHKNHSLLTATRFWTFAHPGHLHILESGLLFLAESGGALAPACLLLNAWEATACLPASLLLLFPLYPRTGPCRNTPWGSRHGTPHGGQQLPPVPQEVKQPKWFASCYSIFPHLQLGFWY